jgi:hypothetical protein
MSRPITSYPWSLRLLFFFIYKTSFQPPPQSARFTHMSLPYFQTLLFCPSDLSSTNSTSKSGPITSPPFSPRPNQWESYPGPILISKPSNSCPPTYLPPITPGCLVQSHYPIISIPSTGGIQFSVLLLIQIVLIFYFMQAVP